MATKTINTYETDTFLVDWVLNDVMENCYRLDPGRAFNLYDLVENSTNKGIEDELRTGKEDLLDVGEFDLMSKIEKDERLNNLKIVDYAYADTKVEDVTLRTINKVKNNYDRPKYMVFEDPENKQVYFVFGNNNYDKVYDNCLGGLNSGEPTMSQKLAYAYFLKVMEEQGYAERGYNVHLTGHGDGGNKAMFVSAEATKNDIDIESAISLNGQGFSPQYVNTLTEEQKERLDDTCYSVCTADDYLSPWGSPISDNVTIVETNQNKEGRVADPFELASKSIENITTTKYESKETYTREETTKTTSETITVTEKLVDPNGLDALVHVEDGKLVLNDEVPERSEFAKEIQIISEKVVTEMTVTEREEITSSFVEVYKQINTPLSYIDIDDRKRPEPNIDIDDQKRPQQDIDIDDKKRPQEAKSFEDGPIPVKDIRSGLKIIGDVAKGLNLGAIAVAAAFATQALPVLVAINIGIKVVSHFLENHKRYKVPLDERTKAKVSERSAQARNVMRENQNKEQYKEDRRGDKHREERHGEHQQEGQRIEMHRKQRVEVRRERTVTIKTTVVRVVKTIKVPADIKVPKDEKSETVKETSEKVKNDNPSLDDIIEDATEKVKQDNAKKETVAKDEKTNDER